MNNHQRVTHSMLTHINNNKNLFVQKIYYGKRTMHKSNYKKINITWTNINIIELMLIRIYQRNQNKAVSTALQRLLLNLFTEISNRVDLHTNACNYLMLIYTMIQLGLLLPIWKLQCKQKITNHLNKSDKETDLGPISSII